MPAKKKSQIYFFTSVSIKCPPQIQPLPSLVVLLTIVCTKNTKFIHLPLMCRGVNMYVEKKFSSFLPNFGHIVNM